MEVSVLGYSDQGEDAQMLSGIMGKSLQLPRKRDKVGLGDVEGYYQKLELGNIKTVPPGAIKPWALARMFARFEGDEDRVIARINPRDVLSYQHVFLYGRFSDFPKEGQRE